MKRLAFALLAATALVLTGCNQGGTDDTYGTSGGSDSGMNRTNSSQNPNPSQNQPAQPQPTQPTQPQP
jgi:hypothetical protein